MKNVLSRSNVRDWMSRWCFWLYYCDDSDQNDICCSFRFTDWGLRKVTAKINIFLKPRFIVHSLWTVVIKCRKWIKGCLMIKCTSRRAHKRLNDTLHTFWGGAGFSYIRVCKSFMTKQMSQSTPITAMCVDTHNKWGDASSEQRERSWKHLLFHTAWWNWSSNAF